MSILLQFAESSKLEVPITKLVFLLKDATSATFSQSTMAFCVGIQAESDLFGCFLK